MDNTTVNSRNIIALASYSESNKNFFELLARRRRNSAVTTVEQGMEFAKGDRKDVVDLFKRLQELSLGTFVIGRRGGQSRFEWSVRLTDVGQAYAGEIDEVEPASPEDLQEEEGDFSDEGLVEHEYRLRPDQKITFALPNNLTEKEAMRLANFINTLPFDSE